jgi:hypothetical protein
VLVMSAIDAAARVRGLDDFRAGRDRDRIHLGLDGAPVITSELEPTLAKRCADRLQRRNGPVCSKSMQHPDAAVLLH